jgi:hypothetical protein
MYISIHVVVLRLIKKRGKKKIARKKRSVSASLDSESRIAMHWSFFMGSRATLKSNLGFFFIRGPRKRKTIIERQVLEVV